MNPGDATPVLAPLSAGPAAAEPLVSVRGLCKYFPIRAKGILGKVVATVRAVDDLHFDLFPGETLGLVGESGSGKTTAARCILRALSPTAGEVLFRTPSGATVDLAALPERALKPLRPHLQMIFQDPYSSLNPRMTVGEIVAEPLVIHRLGTRAEQEARVVDILRKVGLKAEHRTRYPHAFSGGQRQRIGIARALIMRPSFVVADEAVSALDVSVQAQVLNLLKDLQEEFKLTYLFVAHNLDVVRHFCDRVAVLYAGRMVELAPAAEIFADPKHPYTRALLSAVPWPDPDVRLKFDVPGEIADPSRLPSGCAFHPRCPSCFGPCKTHRPKLQRLPDSNRQVACHLHFPAD
ncbi:MAG: oligopeptide/dipeptide ABC transporter ATP-binding protein [Opitutaceae bacterium]